MVLVPTMHIKNCSIRQNENHQFDQYNEYGTHRNGIVGTHQYGPIFMGMAYVSIQMVLLSSYP